MTTKDGTAPQPSDADGNERAVFEVSGHNSPALRVLDINGEQILDALTEKGTDDSE